MQHLKLAMGLITAILGKPPLWQPFQTIHTIPFEYTDEPSISASNIDEIVVDSRYCNTTDMRGDTLIPPTLFEFATTFAADWNEIVGRNLPVSSGTRPSRKAVYLTLGRQEYYTDNAGRETSERYTLTTGENGILISGASPLGAWWGTRTLLQQITQRHRFFAPAGTVSDSPAWDVRGMMLDVGRHFYPKDFLIEMCAYMSFFKQSTFHLHLSDNLFNNPGNTEEQSMDVYARFRLSSNSEAVAGLNKYRNESYTREDFDEIQTKCAARGVTILPELEAPGHALVIVQWKPQIGYKGDLSLLNITHPDTIPTMKTIWGEFLPWFHTKVVSIGADEYPGPATDYNDFVNEMDNFIGTTSNKSIRIWGTFPPVYNETYNNIYQNVSIQHWQFFEDDPWHDYIRNNYSVVNSNDDFYMVNKWGIYPNKIDLLKTLQGSPDQGLWYPNIFHQRDGRKNPPNNNPFVQGGITPLWNDYGPNAPVYSEAFHAWRDGIPALADKQWGGALSDTFLDPPFAHDDDFKDPQRHSPGHNLDRAIPSDGKMIFSFKLKGKSFDDTSRNHYKASVKCWDFAQKDLSKSVKVDPECPVTTPFSSKGRDYHLLLSFRIEEAYQTQHMTLLSGRDSSLMLTPNITLFASGNYYRLNSTVPYGKWTDIHIIGVGNRTFALFNFKKELDPGRP